MVPPVCNRQGPPFCTKTGAILHVSTGISARSLIPKVGSLRELISIHLGAASYLTDPTNCNREGPEIPADRLPNAGGVAPRTGAKVEICQLQDVDMLLDVRLRRYLSLLSTAVYLKVLLQHIRSFTAADKRVLRHVQNHIFRKLVVAPPREGRLTRCNHVYVCRIARVYAACTAML